MFSASSALPTFGRETALVTDGGREALLVGELLQRMEDFRAGAQRLAEARRADRHDHAFLEVEAVVGVRATVDHVHHRHRHGHAARAAEVAVQRQTGFFGRCLGHGHRHRQRGVGAETRLVFRAVELDQRAVDEGLLFGVETDDGFGNFGIDVFDCGQHALAEVAVLVAVAQLDGFARAGRRTGRHRGATHDARFEQYVRFNSGVAARIEDFARNDIDNCTHGRLGPLKISGGEWSSVGQTNADSRNHGAS
jgi:hypothetical protein